MASILGNWREGLTYSTGLVKHSDHRSLRKLLHLNHIIATSEVKSMFNMISGRKREGGGGGGGEHQGSSQAKVDMLKIWNDVPIIEWTKEQL